MTACGDDDRTPPRDGGMSDAGPCDGLTACTTVGVACGLDTLIECAVNADGCMVETRTNCAATGGSCDDSSGTAMCIADPCGSIPAGDRCTTEGVTCDGDALVDCAPDASGCLVRTATDCAASPGGACDPSGSAPMCVLPADPCEALPADERCTDAGTSCTADTLVTCAANAFGCLVLTDTDCTARAGGTCDDTTGLVAACTFTGDPCDGITECATAGASCDGPELVSCALDGFGCMVETRLDCTDTTFGFCDTDATPAAMCSTAAVDPCLGMTVCDPAGRTCVSDTLHVCARNPFGCLIDTATDCTTTGEICGDSGGIAVCDDICAFRDACPGATYCDGNDAVTCTADADGCFIESDRTACADTSTACAAGACSGMCTGVSPTIIDCASGTVTGDTASGTMAIGAYAPCTSLSSYSNMEQVFYFVNNEGPMDVSITSTRGAASSADFDLFVLGSGDGSMMCGAADTCVDGSTGSGPTETVDFGAPTGSLFYVVYDLYGSTASTSDFTLGVTCTPIVCGDGVVGSTEECDDGNTTAADGCDSACAVETDYLCTGEPSVCVGYARITETEPNEDGTPSTGGSSINGNDFDATAVTNADANGAITANTIVSAALTAAGDEDVFAVSNTGAADVMVTFETGAPTLGVCPDDDTGIRVREADGTDVDRDDDDGPGACSLLTVTIPAGTTYYVQVVEWGDDDAIPAYELAVTFP